MRPARAILRPLLALAFFCVLAPGAFGERLTGRVIGVSDGDTLTLLVNRRPVTIRLHGIDAPEHAQAFGTRSKQALSALAFGKTATAEVVDTDRYGRLVAVVTVAGRNLNREQVRAGMAWWYRQYAPDDRDLQALEQEARKAKRGLWRDPAPIPPWEYRLNGSRPAPPSAEADTGLVYITPTGRKYHRRDCPTLRATVIPISRPEATARGYGPCKVCRP